MPTEFYKVDGGKLSLREYWRMAGNPFVFLIAAIAKLFGGLPIPTYAAKVDQLHLRTLEELPEECGNLLRPAFEAMPARGYRLLFLHEVPQLVRGNFTAGGVFLADDRRSFAVVLAARSGTVAQVAHHFVIRDSDHYFIVTNEKPALKQRPHRTVIYLTGRSPDEVHARFQEERDRHMTADQWNDADLRTLILREEQEFIEFHAARGVLKRMSESEIREVRENS